MRKKFMSVLVIALLLLITALSVYGTSKDKDISGCLENGVMVKHESPDDMAVIDASIPEIDKALESIPDGERRDLIWEYWFTPISEEITVYNDPTDLTLTSQEIERRKERELALIQELLQMPIEDLRIKVEESRIMHQQMKKAPSVTKMYDEQGNEI